MSLIHGERFNWNPPQFSKYKIPCKLAWNFSKCQKGFVLRNLRGCSIKICHPVDEGRMGGQLAASYLYFPGHLTEDKFVVANKDVSPGR